MQYLGILVHRALLKISFTKQTLCFNVTITITLIQGIDDLLVANGMTCNRDNYSIFVRGVARLHMMVGHTFL